MSTVQFGDVTKHDVKDFDALLEKIEEHERLARFKTFTSENAWELGSAIRSLYLERYGHKKDLGIIIAIRLFSGHQLFASVVGDAPAVSEGNWAWASGKFNVVKKTSRSSLNTGRFLAKLNKTPESAQMPFPEYATHGGGFPVWIKGVDVGPIGAILVSGLPQLEDHQLIVDGIAKVSHLLASVEA